MATNEISRARRMRRQRLGIFGEWRKSNDLWYYKPDNRPSVRGTSGAKETLNAVKFGTEWKVYHDKNPNTIRLRAIKILPSRTTAISFMKSFMKRH